MGRGKYVLIIIQNFRKLYRPTLGSETIRHLKYLPMRLQVCSHASMAVILIIGLGCTCRSLWL